MLGVSNSVGNFSSCSDDVGFAFDRNLDIVRPAKSYVAELLERGIPVLVYVGTLAPLSLTSTKLICRFHSDCLTGTYDWKCSWLDNLAWTNALEWTHGATFAEKPLKEWMVDGVRAGRTKSAGGLTYATVDEAGHMVSPAFGTVRRTIAEDRAGTVRPSGAGIGNAKSMVGGRGSICGTCSVAF